MKALEEWRVYPRNEDEMSAIDSAARDWTAALEDRERSRSGASLPIARRAVARRLGVAPGSLENLRRGRTKGVRAWLFERLRAAFIREAQQEINRLQHELDIARQSGMDPRDDQTCEVAAHIEALRALLK